MTTQPSYRRKLIEVDLPLDDINRESAREKSIRHGHPSTLHLWWSRKPLAACRAVIFASLVDDPADCSDEFPTEDAQRAERQRLHELIKKLVRWENSSDVNLLAEARYEIARSVARSQTEQEREAPPDKGRPDAVLDYLNRQAKPIYDPFCGGGSIPLEAQRLGLRAVGSDLNPVAVLITKALIELPPRFANQPPVNPDADPMGLTVGKGKRAERVPWRGAAGLADDVRYYGRKMREMAWERIGHLYPNAKLPDGGEATVIAWLWARTVPCPNPACGVAMPLMTTFQASKKRGNEHWMWPEVDREAKTVSFTMRNLKPPPDVVSVDRTVTRNGATCVACNGAVNLAYVRQQARDGNMGEVMTGVVAEGDRKRLFLTPKVDYPEIATTFKTTWKPSGNLPERALGFGVQGYGFIEWNKLFTERQLTGIGTFSAELMKVGEMVIADGGDVGYANAIRTYLALAIGRTANSSSSFSRWQNSGDFVAGVFAMPTLPMLWDFVESNPFCTATQNWLAQVEWIAKVVENLPVNVNHGEVRQADAAMTIHDYNGPVIVTDPPYYSNIGYADLSDFFYVWLRPLLRDTYPDLFAGILTPKNEEMIAAPQFENAEQRFETLMSKTLHLIKQQCSPDFPSSIFYAYKQQEQEREGVASTGWETMLTALVNAGFQIVGTWPMRTERPGRARQIESNALASSVILVCRPREGNPVASRQQFLSELAQELPSALAALTREGHIAPVDLAQAAIGPGMKAYSRYSRVETFAGEPVTVRDALVAINRAIADYDRQEAGALDAATRFCVDWIREHGHGNGSYGVAETLAVAKNVVVDDLAHTHRLLASERGRVSLLPLECYEPERPPPRERGLPLPLTAWEGCFRIAYHLGREGEGGQGIAGAGQVARQMGSDADGVERLARILYNYYDRKGDSANAVIFNNLVTAWTDIMEKAQEQVQPELAPPEPASSDADEPNRLL